MANYKIGSRVRIVESGIERTGTVVGYGRRNSVMIEDDQLKSITDNGFLPYFWMIIPTDDCSIIPLGDDNA